MGYLETIAHPTQREGTETHQIAPEEAHCADCALVERAAFPLTPMKYFLEKLWFARDPMLIEGVNFVPPHAIENTKSPWTLGKALLWCYVGMESVIKLVQDIPV